MNRIIISGFVSSEPISRYTSNGNHVIHFSVSVRKGTKRNDDGTGYAVNFFDVDAWGKTAEITNDRLVKGEKVYIEGRLDNDIYEQSGQKRSRTKIIAEYIEYSAIAYDDDEQEVAKPQQKEAVDEASGTSAQNSELSQEENPLSSISEEYGVTEEEIPF